MSVKTTSVVVGEQLSCRLCTLPVRSAVHEAGHEGSLIFCCQGCRNVWRILIESGQLDGLADPRDSPLYQKALAAGILGNDSAASSTPTPPPPQEVTPQGKGGTVDDNRQCVVQINGMWCSSCSWLIEHSLMRQRGVISAVVSFSSDTARIIYKPAKTDETVLAKTITDLGYSASPLGESSDSDPKVIARRREFLGVVVAIAFAMNVMMMQLILYAGYFEGITGAIRRGLPWLLLTLSLPVIWAASRPIFYRAYQAARHGAATMETLVSLGAGAAFAYSIWQTFAGTGHVYYDTADMLLGLVMLGKHIESGARQTASDALSLLYGLLPKKANVLRDGAEFAVAISHLSDGDVIVVKAGERVGADGTVQDGSATVDESLLSGEARPVNKRTGDRAIGGTVLLNGTLTVEVDHTGGNGILNQIISHVEDALSRKTESEKLADRISRIFVPVVLFLALLSGLALCIAGHTSTDAILTRVVAVLVIACPCALGIATPMAISAGIASAARSGILVSDGTAFESLKCITDIVFDKTGTATEAIFEVAQIIGSFEDSDLLCALEGKSSHPIAVAIIQRFASPNRALYQVEDFTIHDGTGISAIIDGKQVFAGNARAAVAAGLDLSSDLKSFGQQCGDNGLTVIYWGIASEAIRGAIALGDRVRSGASDAIVELKSMGIRSQLLSGDSSATTSYIANQLSMEIFHGDISPTEKAKFIDSLKHDGLKVCMVGDGVNDAPALARADVGIALASGTDIASKTAQVTLLKPDLQLLPGLIRLSRRTVGVMKLNLFWAFAYNVICIPLAMLGYVTPLWAVIAMLLSSLTVILNTQRLMRNY